MALSYYIVLLSCSRILVKTTSGIGENDQFAGISVWVQTITISGVKGPHVQRDTWQDDG